MHAKRLWILSGVVLLCAVFYMTLGANGHWEFVLPFRGAKLAALLLVAVAIATSTVLFQTITQNRILTPAIMGFDALYILILTGIVFFMGGQSFLALSAITLYIINISVLVVAALLLFGTLLGKAQGDLMRMILTGIIFGVLFRSLTSFWERMIDPNDYAVVQVSSYARFAQVETSLLLISAVLTGITVLICWRMRHRLDVIALGHTMAVNLGENPDRIKLQVLVMVSVLVSVSTALVGPVAFLGLLVVSLAHIITPNMRHAVLLPSAALISGIVLVGGQMLLERVFHYATPLMVIVDLVGGSVFMVLLMRGLRR